MRVELLSVMAMQPKWILSAMVVETSIVDLLELLAWRAKL
jgi:hypothetical protein